MKTAVITPTTAGIKDVRVAISGVSMNFKTYFKLLRCIKKHEPEIWDEVKDTVFDSLESAAAKADASKNGLHLQNVVCSELTHLVEQLNNRCIHPEKDADLLIEELQEVGVYFADAARGWYVDETK